MEIVTLVLAGLACALSLANLLRRPRGLSGEDLEKVRQDLLAEIRQTRQELSGSVAAGLQASNVQTEQKLESIRTTMEVRLNAMQAVTDRRLGEMRQTVDEKLQKTLEDRLQKSFGLVSQQLELVYKGLGEMRTLAAGVGDLKKVLSNVKTRGILGEVQLGAILEQLLAPGQYAENVATVPGSSERVEFAVKLPGDGDGPVWLPIDAKFPQDAYAALLAAYDTADKAAVELAAKELDKRVRGFGKDIHDKYIAPGHTTDFGVMFLPVEGLYAEVVRRGTAERLQREYKIVVAGPTTMAALLNSLQMGFKTLAIQKRSSEVWKVLGSVKAEFDTFGQALAQAQNRLNQASSELENLVGVRTRQIQRKLQQVTLLPGEGDRAENLPPEQKDGY
ncbi:DNA recombination protein RmuC [Candidatus Allofournierella merdipullorum]|uniref:DNA recombination protein RmuC n=1 Tax=Candidatus Allofournierella merdipullorum TaxID=2838595 RepID=UPI002A8D60F2|nr:DNA recombination protein RmuC [Candidatus Fournierella merdipullorum]